MATATLHRFDKLPSCCIRCGEPATRTLRLKFAPKNPVTLATVVIRSKDPDAADRTFDITMEQQTGLASLPLAPKSIGALRRIIPSIEWALPFCDAHARGPSLRQRFQLPLLLLACGVLAAGVWSLIATNLTWPFVASFIAGPLLVPLAHHL